MLGRICVGEFAPFARKTGVRRIPTPRRRSECFRLAISRIEFETFLSSGPDGRISGTGLRSRRRERPGKTVFADRTLGGSYRFSFAM
jgi:hypothetical protein